MRVKVYFLVALFSLSVNAQAEPVSRMGSSFYYVEGNSALVLMAEMDKKGPVGLDGRNHPALTKWDVQWRFRHNMHGSICKMEKVSVMVGVSSIQPRWRGEAEGPASLRERWKELIKAVERDVKYHRKQALDAGNEIEQVLNLLEPTSSCRELSDEANRIANEVLGTHKSNSRDYDLGSDYGRKNGVSLI